jgi:predicted aldo/keto reductase-like oxidoreductase
MSESQSIPRRVFFGAAGAAALALVAGCKKKEEAAPLETAPATNSAAIDREIPKRPLGSTGEMVSIVGVGGYHIGKVKDELESIKIVRAALDRGVTFLDNCWDYHEGKSEERMGKALEDGYRNKAFLMTKIDGRTKKAAADQIDQSLKRLQTDHIDLIQIHEVIRMNDSVRCFIEGGCIEALVDAKKAGKLRYIGFTGHKDPNIHLAMLKAAEDHGFRFDTVQMPLNVMDAHYRSFEQLVLPHLVQKKIGVLGMKSLGSGKILQAGKVSPVDCLHYAMNLPTSVVITGIDSTAILEQAIHAALQFKPMSREQVRALLDRTRDDAKDGKYEVFKTTTEHDGTTQHPEWLESASI